MPELSTVELEKGMRPGAWSRAGFLGHNEALEAVLRLDAEVLAFLGVTHRRIADTLEQILHAGLKTTVKLAQFRLNRKSAAKNEPVNQVDLFQTIFAGVKPDHSAPQIEFSTKPLEERGDRCVFQF